MRNYEGFAVSALRMVILGRQGSGKGTQSLRLAAVRLYASPPATCFMPPSRRAPSWVGRRPAS